MIYHCDQCGAPLSPGVTACPACGRRFDHPVPPDAEAAATPTDALLRGRTASGAPGSISPGPASYPQTPASKGSGRAVGVWTWVGGSLLAVVLLVGLLFWGAYALWMRGTGGEMAYRQHNLAGNAAAERGDFGTADDEYTQMIALRPRRVDGYLLRAITEFQAGQFTASIDDDTAGLGLTHEPMVTGDLLYNRAGARVRRGDLVGAIADFTQANRQFALVRDPRELPHVARSQQDTLRQRADAYWQHKDYARAIADSSAAINRGHPRPDDYGVRAKAEAALSQDTAAGADFLRAVQRDPSYLDGYTGLGNLADKHHQYGQVVAVFGRATRADPGNAPFWGSLGWFQYESGQFPQAIASDRCAQSLNPNQSWVNFNLGLCYAVSGDKARAEAAYADALAHISKADQKAALTDIRNALARQPGSAALQQTQRPMVTLSSAGTEYLWSGPEREDGTVPTLQVVISQDDGSLAAHFTSQQVTQMTPTGMGENHTGLVLSPVTACTIGGLPFAHGDWHGIGMRTGKLYAGSQYCSVAPSQIINLVSHDAAPHSQTTLPLLQTSILTFRKL